MCLSEYNEHDISFVQNLSIQQQRAQIIKPNRPSVKFVCSRFIDRVIGRVCDFFVLLSHSLSFWPRERDPKK
jgi:hypothetical protein